MTCGCEGARPDPGQTPATLLRQIFEEAGLLPVRLFAFTGERAIELYHRLGFPDVKVDPLHTELVWRAEP
ncbi:MAG: hypothetical protein CFE26_15660 [Verrucomicrobiales bacterium VVV1]|nr:MAG: hypothetical protein CFE26_15660 [Verrucomicrobiales bacterium VVV1]